MSRYLSDKIMVPKLLSLVEELVDAKNYIDALAALWEIQYDYGPCSVNTTRVDKLAQKILREILPRISSRFPKAIDQNGEVVETSEFSNFFELTSSHLVHCIVCNNSYRLLPGYSTLRMLLEEGTQVEPDLAVASGHFGLNNSTYLPIAGICSNIHSTLECTFCRDKANYLSDPSNYLSLVKFSLCIKDQQSSLSAISAPKPKRRQLQTLATSRDKMGIVPSLQSFQT